MNPRPFLVVDKKGVIGEALCEKLVLKSLTVFVSQKKPRLENIVFVAHNNTSPEIPGYTYLHIFVIDDGTITTDHLVEFSEKAEKDNAKLTFITSLFDASSFYKKIIGFLGRAKIIIVGDIIGNNTYPALIHNAIKSGKIILENEGLSKAYPVFLDDVVRGIITAEEDNSATSIFYLFPKHPPTELSLAQMIQKAKKAGRKIYVATNLLESMITSPNPTRAEVNDIFHTLNDGADGLVLAAETGVDGLRNAPARAANPPRRIP